MSQQLKYKRVLLTNDDGIHAPGLRILSEIAQELFEEVYVIAPQMEQSGMGHAITLRHPLRVTQVDTHQSHVNGTPADCVMLALEQVMAEYKPDLVLSGINNGENLAQCVTLSGTVGAALEATLYGIPAIALSQVTEGAEPHGWATSRALGLRTLKQILPHLPPRGKFLNVNFPYCAPKEVKGIRMVKCGQRTYGNNVVEGIDPLQRPYYWVGVQHSQPAPPEGCDLWAIAHNYIAVSVLQGDYNCYENMQRLQPQVDYDFSH